MATSDVHIGGILEQEVRWRMKCYICGIQSQDTFENRADALTQLSIHNQIAGHELGYQRKVTSEDSNNGL